MSSASQYDPQYTVDDYQLWEGDWELWNGVAVAMTPSPFGQHSKLLAELTKGLGNAVDAADCDATVLVEIDWILTNNTILRPDLTIVCGGAPERHLETPPALVAEILSPSTRERDLTFKRQFFQQQNVPWYLVIDPDTSDLDALKLNTDGNYSSVEHTETLSIDICGDCRLNLSVERLFR